MTALEGAKKARILCIEDEPEIAELICVALRNRGHDVEVATTGKAAINAFKLNRFDIATIDYQLPDMTGLDIARKFIADVPDVPIVIVTARGTEGVVVEALRLGVANYIVKDNLNSFLDLLPVAVEQALEKQTLINKNKAFQARHSEQQDHLQGILDGVVDGIITINEKGKIQSFNKATESIFGYELDEMIGRNVSVLMPNPDKRKHNSYLKNYLSSGDAKIIGIGREVVGLRKDGSRFPLSLAVSELKRDGKSVFTGIVRDITILKQAEDSLRKSEEQNRLLLNSVGDGIYGVDSNGEFTFANPAALKILGYSLEDLLGQGSHDLIHHSYADGSPHPIDKCPMYNAGLNGELYTETDDVFWRKNGSSFPTEYTSTPIINDGELIGNVVTFKDISERKESELRIENLEGRFLDAIEAISESVYLYDKNDQFVMGNSKVYEEFSEFSRLLVPGAPVKEIIQSIWDELLHPDAKTDHKGWLKEILAFRDEPRSSVVQHLKDDRWVEVLRYRTADDSTLIIRTDVTERKKAEAALAETEIRFRALIENSPAMITLKDLEGHFIIANEAFKEMMGLSEIDIIGKTAVEAGWPDDNHNEGVNKCRMQVIESQRPLTQERDMRSPEGRMRPCIVTNFPVFNDANKVVAVGQILADITDLKNTEEALKNAKIVADEANRAKSDFLSSMSHELRTPLNAILGFAQLLESNSKERLTEIQAKSVDHIRNGGDHLLKLINDVLDLAKIESGKVDLSKEDVAVKDILRECISLVNNNAAELELSINHHYAFPGEPFIFADKTRLKQVLLNLLSNAVKYNTQNGKVTITCEKTPEGALRTRITDTGIGIAKEKQSEVFQAFNRLGAETTTIEGSGIGLMVTKRLVEEMGGVIGFESEVGKGSTFWTEFPLMKLDKDDKDIEGGVEKDERVSKSKNLSGRILYVEDNQANVQLMEMIIGRIDGLTMISAPSAELGLDIAASEILDLIIMDINLPGLNGFQAFEKLKKMDQTLNTPVIALSANATRHDIEMGKNAGFHDYLTKPIDVAEIHNSIEIALK
jgi:PAS domain S-box-containing protein